MFEGRGNRKAVSGLLAAFGSFTYFLSLFRLALAAFGVKRGLFYADDRIVFGVFVYFEPFHIFLGDGHVRIDGFDRAFGQTGVAIDAGIGVDK